jgi:phosphatidylserine/phosphatidylglycerophosphate/cardiolipin synthase-like enzyme
VLRLLALPLLLLAVPLAGADPMLVAVVPDLPGSEAGGEAFAVGSDTAADLSGWTVTDGDRAFTFPAGTAATPGQPVWVAMNQAEWARHGGPPALLGDLRLGNDGDTLRLLDPAGAEADAVSWESASPGLVLQRDRDPLWVDTDRPQDWATPRTHKVGETALPQPTFTVQAITAYASPDSSFAVLDGLARGARERLHLHVYELRSMELVDALVAAKAASPGLDLQVLVDEAPVGMTASERHLTADALRRVQAAGGQAWLAQPGRYDDWHLKVLVADGVVALQSENWVASGVPVDPSTGNRGWGVALQSREAADWFAGWMAADRAAWDVAPFELAAFDPQFEPPGRAAARVGDYGPLVPARRLDGPFEVVPLVAPDHTADPRRDPVARLVAAAQRRVDAQQLDLAVEARNQVGWAGPDPLAAAFAEAAGRGVAVRVQAAAPFAATDAGNGPELAWLAARGVATQVLDRPGLGTLHNKGIVVDDAVVLGSMNGNHHSRSENREAGVVLRGPGVADYYAALFEADWAGETERDWSVVGQDLRGLPAQGPIVILGLLLASRSRR